MQSLDRRAENAPLFSQRSKKNMRRDDEGLVSSQTAGIVLSAKRTSIFETLHDDRLFRDTV
jgi:hypothetical protein